MQRQGGLSVVENAWTHDVFLFFIFQLNIFPEKSFVNFYGTSMFAINVLQH